MYIQKDQQSRARLFVEAYIALCNKYNAEVVVNAHGVHCVSLDEGGTSAFATVYPEWMCEDK